MLEYILDLVRGLLGVLSFQAEAELQEQYFEPLVKKEQMEEKMRNIREVKCRVVTCKTVSAGDGSQRGDSGAVGPCLVTGVLRSSFHWAGNSMACDSPGPVFP